MAPSYHKINSKEITMGKKLDKITPTLTAEEKLVICELISTYSFMWDEKNAIGFSHLFAEKCV